jgi:hypothetical protein
MTPLQKHREKMAMPHHGKQTLLRSSYPAPKYYPWYLSDLIMLGPDPESLPHYFRRVTSRSVTIMVVNDTKEQLELDSNTTNLSRGKWGQGSVIPAVIPPGGSALWRCSSAHVAQGLEGAVTYRFAGDTSHDRVQFAWKNRYFGPNKYDAATSRDGCKLLVEGGDGAEALVALFIGD